MTFKPNTERLLRDLKQRLRALYGERLAEVVLFGSVARGEDTSHSDVDVLVVLHGPVDRYAENGHLADVVLDFMGQYRQSLSPVVMDEATFLSGDWPLLRNVREEGIPL